VIIAAATGEASTETFTQLMDHVAQGFEALGAAILVVGVIWSFALATAVARRSGWTARPTSCCARPSEGPCSSAWRH
jgi:Na+/H+ antiporter NhaC